MNKFKITLSIFKEMILSPDLAFAVIKKRGDFFILFVFILLSMSLVQIVYLSQVDPAWYGDYATRLLSDKMAPDQISRMKKYYQPEFLSYVQPIVIFFGYSLFWSLQSLYLLIIGNIKKADIIFSEWFALVVWSSAPQIFVALLSLLNLSIGDNSHLTEELINPINFANLFSIDPSSTLYATLATTSVFTLWSFYLLLRGIKQWLSVSWIGALLIAFAPVLLIGYFLY
ncbi:MAG TPA: hypothetical protein ENJ60_08535 [Aeromonadales bacterium]|nr:hypothetical protein [Aeromonadales bacterium]